MVFGLIPSKLWVPLLPTNATGAHAPCPTSPPGGHIAPAAPPTSEVLHGKVPHFSEPSRGRAWRMRSRLEQAA